MEAPRPDVFEFDVRELARPLRHRYIFQALGALAPGQTLRLINDHDPAPLSYQLRTMQPGQFAWIYDERGPQVWSVSITRVATRTGATVTMQAIEATHSVGQIVSRYPQTRDILVRYGIDLCCGSDLPLAQATTLADVALDDVLAALNKWLDLVSDGDRGAA